MEVRENIPIRALKNVSANWGLCMNNLARLAFFLGSRVARSCLPAISFGIVSGMLETGRTSRVGLELHIVCDMENVRWEACEDAVLREMICVVILSGGVMKGLWSSVSIYGRGTC